MTPSTATPAPTSVGGGDVVVIGDLMVDVVATHQTSLAHGSDTAARVQLVGGGSAANTAAWLGALGDAPRLVAALGDDELGRHALGELMELGVSVEGPVVAGVATGTCVVLVGPDYERTMLPDRGANDRLSADAVARAFDAGAGWLHLSGYSLLGEGSRPAAHAALVAAHAVGCPVSVDAASSAPLTELGPGTFLDWIGGTDVLFANDQEIATLGGLDAALAAVDSVVVKHGSAGATWSNGYVVHRAAQAAASTVDTTGAGDAFAAGWIHARRRGEGEAAALQAAVGLGAEAVSHHGARPLPR